MFTRKLKTNPSQVDELNRKKCAAKVLDIKKDLNSRLRYLKSYIETTDNANELKQYFDQNYSQIFSLFYESFVTVEANIKHRYNKQNRDELDTVLFVFLKILVFQPERLHLRWQVRSIGRIIQKLINSGNTKLIKFSGTRLFLIWYQILNSNKTHVEELMFQKLIQGFDTFHSSSTVNTSMGIDLLNAEAQKVFSNNNSNNNNNNDLTLNVAALNINSSLGISSSISSSNSSNSTNSNTIITALSIGKSIYPYEITPIIPIQPNEQQSNTQQQTTYNNITSEMLKEMLEYMQQDCMSIEWQGDKHQQSQRCYEFLFDEFKRFYLCYMFPNPFMQNNNSNNNNNNNINLTPSTIRHPSISSTSSNFSNSGVNQYSLSLNVYSNLDLLTIVNEQPIPSFERPILSSGNLTTNDERKLVQLHCKEEIIKWLISVLQTDPPVLNTASSHGTLTSSQIGTESSGHETMSNILSSSRSINTETLKANQEDIFSTISEQFDSSLFDRNSLASFSTTITAMSSSSNNSSQQTNPIVNKQILQKVILSSNLNVNLVHEILRNTYFLNFETPNTVQQVLNAYKKWFLKESNMPSFMQEPFQTNTASATSHNNDNNLDSPMSRSITDDDKSISGASINSTEFAFNNEVFQRTSSISSSASVVNDLFQQQQQQQTRIGYMKCLQIFFFHSSNLLLNKTNLQREKIKNICCFTLEIYKLFIRKIKMDYYTWTMLITILLRVAEFLFNSEYLVNNRNDPATSHLIKLITETVLLAIVKASFSFNLNIELWDQLMSLMSSISSNSDVIDKWIEIIDDLIRQVLKTCYNIDINNLPTIETDKRKLKKKTLYPTANNEIPVVTQSNNNNSFLTSINSQQIPVHTKPRSKTEIFSSQSSASTTTLVNSPIAAASASSATSAVATNLPVQTNLNNTQQSPQTKHVSPTGNSTNINQSTNQKNLNNKSNSQISVSQSISSTVNVPAAVSAVQPLLSRQRTMTVAEIESTKSPSLSDEHFLGIENNNNNNTNSKKSNKKINSASNTPNNKPKKFSFNNSDMSNQDSSNQEDENDDSYDKSSTLKANNQYSSVSATTSPNTSSNSSRPINKHNSEKSIYFSSELLTEQSNNNNHQQIMNINDNDSSNSSNSQTQNLSFMSSSPPLPPLPMPSNFQFTTPPPATNPGLSKFSPPFQQQAHPQQPPPLPPLPPELASKYALNKTALNLDTIESNNNINNNATNNINNKNCDTISIDSDNNNKPRDLQFNNACSDVIDVFYMNNNSNAQHVDTPSEAASMSGGDLSGEIYASPISHNNQVNGNYQSSENSITPPPPSSSSSFVPTVPLLPGQNLNEIYSPNNNNNSNSLLMSTLNNTDTFDTNSASNGLLSIDHRNNDERGGSFIESKYISKDAKSKGSTLTASTTLQDLNNQTQSNRNSGITPNEMQKVNNVLLTNTFESMFKETANCLIKRLFGCLGNVNAIKDPLIHRKVFEFIYNKWDRLNKIKDNFKLTDLSQVVPSITYFAPWLFEAIYQLSNHYQSGKLIAYKTICRIGIKSSCNNSGIGGSLVNDYDLVSDEFMDLFYLTIHQGLHSEDKHIVNCIIQNCGTKFWHCMLPSCTLLLKDFIVACASIDKDGPKYDASSILGCLISFPDYFGDMQVLAQPAIDQFGSLIVNEDILNVEFCSKEDLKNLIIQNITNFNDDIFNTNSRCVILCALTCFIYEEILNQRWHPRLNDAIRRIFKDLDFREQFNPVLVKMSCDNLRFLSILANLIFQYEIQYAINIINELNQCLVKLINTKPSVITEDYEKAIIANMFALLEWCMSMPLDKLKDQDRATLLRNNFKLIIHICNTFKSSESSETEHIHLAARFIIHHLLTKLNHFPFGSSGPSKIVSSVNETSDLGLSNDDELSAILFEQPNLQFFTLNNQFLISFVELPMKGNEQYFNVNTNLKFSTTICRFIVRDFCGKNCWDCCILQSPDESLPKTYFLDIPFKKTDSQNETLNESLDEKSKLTANKQIFDYTQLSLIDLNQIPKDLDILDNILKYISFSSPECRLEPNKPLNLLWDLNANLNSMLKLDEVKQKIINQTTLEQKQSIAQQELEMQILETKQEIFCHQQTKKPDQNDSNNYSLIHSHFNLCKSFVHQIGLLSWEKRQSFNLLKKTPQLLRELKSLDDQTCRETHKIALIYIAEGQDEKISILSNERGSQDYEDFLSMLAWSVDLESHEGFMGGLQHNYQMKTAPYYANSICEVLFHVSTQINNQNDPNKISKWRHLGNDSVQIIWSEHNKDYDRNILATEFADVIICIYPLKNGLYRIQITKKSSIGFFGPLFDGAIINKQALPTLIRATAINASRVLLSNTKGYQDFFVHRAHSINNIIKTLTEKQTFEQFIADIYSPASNVSSTGLSINTSVQSGSIASSINNNGLSSNTFIGSTITKKENQDQF